MSTAQEVRHAQVRRRGPATTAVIATVLALVGGLLLVSSSATSAAPRGRYLDEIFNAKRTPNLVYGRVQHPDGSVEKLRLDLYRPRGDRRRKRPAVIFIHGGDSSVDKRFPRNRLIPRRMAMRGFVGASINYREGTFGATREAQHDTRAAVRFLKARAGRYRIDPDKIVLIGSSAGAMDALNVNFDPADTGESGHPNQPSDVAGAISIGGGSTEPFDITLGEPPIAMIHAEDDPAIPIAAADATCEQTKAMGNVCEFFRYAAGGHPPGFIDQHKNRLIEQSARFMCRNVIGLRACHDRNDDGVRDRR